MKLSDMMLMSACPPLRTSAESALRGVRVGTTSLLQTPEGSLSAAPYLFRTAPRLPPWGGVPATSASSPTSSLSPTFPLPEAAARVYNLA